MITRATVIKTSENKAIVRAVRKSACEGCEGCSDKGKCHAEMLFSDSPRFYELEVDNEAGAVPGDVVEVQSTGKFILLFAVVVFVVPVAVAIISYFLSYGFLDGHYPLIISSVSFVTAFFAVAFAANKLAPICSQNKISKIIKENSDVAVCTNAHKE